MYKRRRTVGTFLGVALAALLPGIRSTADAMPWAVILTGCVFLIVNQLIYSYPSDIRSARPLPLLALGAIGVVQDTLIWLLVDRLGDETRLALHSDGFPTALLGGAIVRASVLALLAMGPRPASASTEQA